MSNKKESLDGPLSLEEEPLNIFDIMNDDLKKKIKEDIFFTAAFTLFNESPDDFDQTVSEDVKARKLALEAEYLNITPESNLPQYSVYLYKIFARVAYIIKKRAS